MVFNDSLYAGINNSVGISDYISNNKEDSSFQKLLFKYIDDSGLKDSTVYKKARIDR